MLQQGSCLTLSVQPQSRAAATFKHLLVAGIYLQYINLESLSADVYKLIIFILMCLSVRASDKGFLNCILFGNINFKLSKNAKEFWQFALQQNNTRKDMTHL